MRMTSCVFILETPLESPDFFEECHSGSHRAAPTTSNSRGMPTVASPSRPRLHPRNCIAPSFIQGVPRGPPAQSTCTSPPNSEASVHNGNAEQGLLETKWSHLWTLTPGAPSSGFLALDAHSPGAGDTVVPVRTRPARNNRKAGLGFRTVDITRRKQVVETSLTNMPDAPLCHTPNFFCDGLLHGLLRVLFQRCQSGDAVGANRMRSHQRGPMPLHLCGLVSGRTAGGSHHRRMLRRTRRTSTRSWAPMVNAPVTRIPKGRSFSRIKRSSPGEKNRRLQP